MAYTESDFDRLSWHDCHVWRVELRAGDPETNDWTSDLVLDVDFIAEWLCEVGGGARFLVAPAALVFHGVTDLRIDIDWGNSEFRCALHEVSIDRIERTPIPDQKIFLDRPYYRWIIRLNWPSSGEIRFGAVGFTLTLRAEPVLTDKQSLSRLERTRLAGAWARRVAPPA